MSNLLNTMRRGCTSARIHALAMFAALLLCSCAQKPSSAPVSAALESAQRLERRAQAAYSKGDLLGAHKDYQTAATVYASLALNEPLAVAQLNMAKIDGESGRVIQGLARAEEVLGRTDLTSAARLMAHGRAAALSLALQKTSESQRHLDEAARLCRSTCDAASALAALSAQAMLMAGDVVTARAASEMALQHAKTNADKANALRVRASIGLAEGVGAAPQAIADAEQALAIDQQLGVSARVIADLGVLEKVYALLGNTPEANRYKALHESAQAAREQLRLK